MGAVTGGLREDIPVPCLEVRLPLVLGAVGGSGAEGFGKEGWDKIAGLLEGVLIEEDPPLSNINNPRAESTVEGDGSNPESSGLPVSGKLSMRYFPFLSSVCDSSICLMRNSQRWSSGNVW